MPTPTLDGPVVTIPSNLPQYDTAFAPLSGGRSVLSYADQFYSVDGDPAHVFVTLVNSATGQTSEPVQLSAAGMEDQITVTDLADGRFLVGWRTLTGGVSNIKGRIFNPDGTAAGNGFAISSPHTYWLYKTEFITLADGRVLATWHDGGDYFSNVPQRLNAQFLSADGQKIGDNFTIASDRTSGDFLPRISALAQGGAVIAWSYQGLDSNRINIKIVDDTGIAQALPIVLKSATLTSNYIFTPGLNHFAITGLKDGNFIVAWSETSGTGGDVDSTSIHAQIFGKDGVTSGGQFLMNTSTTGSQNNVNVLALDNGGFVAVWTDSTGNLITAAKGQFFLADGTKSGDEFVVAANGQVGDLYGFDGFKLSQMDSAHIVVDWFNSTSRYQIIDTHFTLLQTGTDANDAMKGTLLNDTIHGGIGDDTITGNTGNDALFGDVGNDCISGADGGDSIAGEEGNDVVYGGVGDDRMFGEAGDDSLRGDENNDFLSGGDGNDTLDGGAGRDSLFGAGGDDLLDGRGGKDLIYAADGNDTLNGGGGSDALFGGLGKDKLDGGNGNDELTGGADKDWMSGGAGEDSFVFKAATDSAVGPNADVIYDFTHLSDHIVLTAFMAGGSFIDDAAFSAPGQVRYDGATGIVSADVNGDGNADWQAILHNKPVLSAADFIF